LRSASAGAYLRYYEFMTLWPRRTTRMGSWEFLGGMAGLSG